MTLGELVVWLVVGALAGTLAGRAVTFKKEGLGRWTNLGVGMGGGLIGGILKKAFNIDFGLGKFNITFEDFVVAFLGSLFLIVVIWIVRKFRAKTEKTA